MNRYIKLSMNQISRISREGLLMLLSLYPLLLAIVGRYLVPFLRETFIDKFDIAPHYPAILTFLILANPYIYGSLAAFLLLDEREENVLNAIRVTPLTFNKYIMTKVAFFFILSFVSGVIITDVVNLIEIPLFESIVINLLLAMATPFNMILINAFASNKVEGFAIVKGTGLLIMIPLLAFYIPEHLNLLAGIVPGYWPAMVLNKVINSDFGLMGYWVYGLIGFVYMYVLTKLFYRRFEKKIS